MTDLNDKTALVRRRIELAQADPPALFVLSEDAKAEDLDEALRIISSLPSCHPERSAAEPKDLSPK